jgi:hypothetical protein
MPTREPERRSRTDPGDLGADVREVPVTELRGIPSFPTLQLDQRLETLRDVDQADWTKAQQREAAIRDALHGDGSMTTRIEAAAKTLGVSPAHSATTDCAIHGIRADDKSHRASARSE